MELVNNSTIETVIDFANVKFGMELTKDQVSEQLRNLSFSQTLKLINSMKADDNDAFSEIIDLSAVSEGWSVLPSIDREKYQERDGLEGPIQTKIGKTLYYDPKEGKYYDPDSDIYIDYDTFKMYDSKENSHWNVDKEEEIPEAYGTATSAQPSRATINAQNSNVANRRYNNTVQDQNRDSSVPNRTVAGSNKQPTGQGAVRAGSADPDDIERANNAQVSAQNQQQSNINAQEIERLKQLAMGR
jgi:uncharacterized protein YijF (DUF1287 family)